MTSFELSRCITRATSPVGGAFTARPEMRGLERAVVFDVDHPVALAARFGRAAPAKEVRPLITRAMPRANVRVPVVQHHVAALDDVEEAGAIEQA